MPTTRHRRTRGRTALTLDDVDFPDLLSLLCGWHPPQNDIERRSRWSTWAEFDAEYELLRAEFLVHEWTLESLERGQPVFAEARYQAKLRGDDIPLE
jgi:hypothetical protein